MTSVEDRSTVDMAASLNASGDYRVLKRLPKRQVLRPNDGTPTKLGIVLDIETTGLGHATDEIIELGMLKFSFSSDGRAFNVIDEFSSFREPGVPIPATVTELTGITDEMVAGKSIDLAAVAAFIDSCVLVIAHSAAFDRPFCEKLFPGFSDKYWACSNTQVDWHARGHRGTRLAYLVNDFGFFYDGHRALDDAYAVLEILAAAVPPTATPALGALLESARKTSIRIWAAGAPFEWKDTLKGRAYRWSDGIDGSIRAWWKDVDEAIAEDELAYLRTEIFKDPSLELPSKRYDGRDRFSLRV